MLLVACVLGCHDARRTNPFDPALTPEVADLQVAVVDSAGAILLAWEPYSGAMPFQSYRVLRKVRGIEAVDTVAVILEPTTASYRDTTAAPDVEYEYRVAVVNAAGYAHESASVHVRSFAVIGVDLLSVSPNPRTGTVTVLWPPYSGPGFEGYEMWRRAFGQEALVLAVVAEPTTGSWHDTTAVPGTVYTYWVRTRLFGEGHDSDTRQLSYELPRPRVTDVSLSSDCACARVAWSSYLGPRFTAYEVLRRSAGQADTVVARIPDLDVTTHVDSLLRGDTRYFYRVKVQTTWQGVAAESGEVADRFHELVDERRLQGGADAEVQAIDLAVDELDGVYAVTTTISSTTARQMLPGVRLHAGGATTGRNYFTQVVPDRLSPVRLAVAGGWVFAVVADAGGLVALAVAPDGVEAWTTRLAEGRPAGLYTDGAEVVLVDQQAVLYRLRAEDGGLLAVSERLRTSLAGAEGLPLQDVFFAAASSAGGLDQWFLLAPERSQHKVLLQIRVSPSLVGGGAGQTFDDGVGPGPGQSLNPLALAYDGSRRRLVVVESRGLLQVLDAREAGLPRHYITGWGSFGAGPGQFLLTPPTAVAVVVDSQGQIHVADAGAPGGRIQTFAR